MLLSDFDSYAHRSDLVKDFSSEAHSSMALHIYDLYKERYIATKQTLLILDTSISS